MKTDLIHQRRKITPLNAWAFSFACAIGWAAFVMPGTVFLPRGGVRGSILAFVLGGAAMCVIAVCYHYLGNLHPDQGGIYRLLEAAADRRTAYVAAWGMGLAHMCCIPLNAKAMAMLIRVMLEEIFGLDFEMFLFGSDTLLLEAVLIVICLFLFGMINIRGLKQTARVQTAGALILLGGIVIMLAAAVSASEKGAAAFVPADPPGTGFFPAFLSIFLIMPWAFVGFDSLSKISQELSFPVRKVGRIMIIAILCGTFAYIANILITLLGMPEGFDGWPAYLASLENLPGIEGFPVATAARRFMGRIGTFIFFASCISATLTGLVGFFTSISRLLSQMAERRMLPGALSKIDGKHGTPVNAIWTVVVLALLLSLMRDSFDFIEEVASAGTSLGFGLVAWTTLRNARARKNRKYAAAGAAGTVLCLGFLGVMALRLPGFQSAMRFRSWFLLMVWVLLGIANYSYFTRNREKSEIDPEQLKK